MGPEDVRLSIALYKGLLNYLSDVAEDNIRCINGVQGTTIQTFFKNVPTLPTWFSDTAQIHLDGEILHGRFLLSPDLERAYPEDNHIGEAWVSSRRQ